MPERLTLAEAASVARTGDVFLFRGRSAADHAIRAFTNSPVNHVGMVIAIDDLPPLLWHAELGHSLPDVWTGDRHRGTQLHRLTDAVSTWQHKYGQRGWMRQIDPETTVEMEAAALRTVNELSGRAFPRTVALAKGSPALTPQGVGEPEAPPGPTQSRPQPGAREAVLGWGPVAEGDGAGSLSKTPRETGFDGQ